MATPIPGEIGAEAGSARLRFDPVPALVDGAAERPWRAHGRIFVGFDPSCGLWIKGGGVVGRSLPWA